MFALNSLTIQKMRRLGKIRIVIKKLPHNFRDSTQCSLFINSYDSPYFLICKKFKMKGELSWKRKYILNFTKLKNIG
jgi:hypothetical protein